MFGCARPPATAASRAIRATCRLLSALPSLVRILTATIRSTFGSCAFQTCPNPPRPDRLNEPVAPVQHGPCLHDSPFGAHRDARCLPGVYSRYAAGTTCGRGT